MNIYTSYRTIARKNLVSSGHMISYEQYIKSIRVYLAEMPIGTRFTPADIIAEYQLGNHNPNDRRSNYKQLLTAIQTVLGWYMAGMQSAVPEYPNQKGYEEYVKFAPDPSRKLVLVQEFPPYEASDGNSYPNQQNVYHIVAG